ncbi:unnamed protein product, partial [Closterium sp. NIES-53]
AAGAGSRTGQRRRRNEEGKGKAGVKGRWGESKEKGEGNVEEGSEEAAGRGDQRRKGRCFCGAACLRNTSLYRTYPCGTCLFCRCRPFRRLVQAATSPLFPPLLLLQQCGGEGEGEGEGEGMEWVAEVPCYRLPLCCRTCSAALPAVAVFSVHGVPIQDMSLHRLLLLAVMGEC